MSEFKGTKEIWVKDITERRNKIIVRIGNCRVIELGTLNNGDCNVPSCCKTEEHANALLISKAPEMLGMLENQLKLIRKIIRIKQIWLPKEPLTAEFSAEYIALSSMFNQLQEQEYQIEQLIKEATEL
jgi:hypothetical protein